MCTTCWSGRWKGEGVSQHALCRGVCIPACTGEGVHVSHHALGRGMSAWGVSVQGGVYLGVSAQGICPGGVCQGGICQTLPSPCEQNDWQMPVKILPAVTSLRMVKIHSPVLQWSFPRVQGTDILVQELHPFVHACDEPRQEYSLDQHVLPCT